MGYRKPISEMTREEAEAVRRLARRQSYLQAAGKAGLIDPTEAIARIRYLHDGRGVTFREIERVSGVTLRSIHRLYRGGAMSCRYATAVALLGARFEFEGQSWLPRYRVTRRLHALVAAGFSWKYLAERLGTTIDILHRSGTTPGPGKAAASWGAGVLRLYDELERVDPLDVGMSVNSVSRVRSIARRNGFPPRSCWDPDTIDDSEAIPEWTGECGTTEGNHIHRRDNIPMCEPCRRAQAALRAERRAK